MPSPADGLGIVIGYVCDQLLADPARAHPVAAFGRLATGLEAAVYADDHAAGARYAAVLVGGTLAAGVTLAAATRHRPVLRTLTTAAVTWTVLGGTSLVREAHGIRELLDSGDLAAARGRLGHLCARDATHLDQPGVVRATVESVAENTSDAAVAPLFWAAVAGIPGLLAYRAINTLDAMVGYRDDRYRRFGTAAARLDDLVNLVPARLTGLLAAACAPVVGGSPRAALAMMRTGAHQHPSPNAGVVEAAFAGGLGVRLGGQNEYAGVAQDRGLLDGGGEPRTDDIDRANRLSRTVTAVAVVLAAAVVCGRRRRP